MLHFFISSISHLKTHQDICYFMLSRNYYISYKYLTWSAEGLINEKGWWTIYVVIYCLLTLFLNSSTLVIKYSLKEYKVLRCSHPGRRWHWNYCCDKESPSAFKIISGYFPLKTLPETKKQIFLTNLFPMNNQSAMSLCIINIW